MRILLIVSLVMILGCVENKPSKKPSAPEVSTKNLIAILDTIWTTEQEPIRLRDSIGRVHGFESEEFNQQNAIYHANHEINEKKIIAILEKYGWPSQEMIGADGNLTICNVLQHSDIAIRMNYLPLMRDAVKNKKLPPRLLARAEDRIATDRGELQIYGGQLKYYPETKTFNVWPIADPANVDKRRAEIGLGPITEFLKRKRNPVEWNVEEQIKRTEAFQQQKNAAKKK